MNFNKVKIILITIFIFLSFFVYQPYASAGSSKKITHLPAKMALAVHGGEKVYVYIHRGSPVQDNFSSVGSYGTFGSGGLAGGFVDAFGSILEEQLTKLLMKGQIKKAENKDKELQSSLDSQLKNWDLKTSFLPLFKEKLPSQYQRVSFELTPPLSDEFPEVERTHYKNGKKYFNGNQRVFDYSQLKGKNIDTVMEIFLFASLDSMGNRIFPAIYSLITVYDLNDSQIIYRKSFQNMINTKISIKNKEKIFNSDGTQIKKYYDQLSEQLAEKFSAHLGKKLEI